ncbi:TPA: phage baseplate assembly protein V [Burkholderia orbicola]
MPSGFTNRIRAAFNRLRGKSGVPGRQSDADCFSVPVEIKVGAEGHTLQDVNVERVTVRWAVNEIPSATLELAWRGDYLALDGLATSCAVNQPIEIWAGELRLAKSVVGATRIEGRRGSCRAWLRLKSPLQGLKVRVRSRVFTNMTDRQILKTILDEHGLSVSVDSDCMSGRHDQRVQWNCADWTFMRGLTGLHGVWLWPHSSGRVRIGLPGFGGKSHRLSALTQALKVQSVTWEKTGLTLPQNLSLEGWAINDQKSERRWAVACPVGEGGLDPRRIQTLTKGALAECRLANPQVQDPALLQAGANALLLAQHAQALRVDVTMDGIQDIEPGDTVELADFGDGLSGRGIITAIEYELDGTAPLGKTTLSVGLDEAAAQPTALPVPVGLLMGKVAPFKVDQRAGWHRLPVTVPLLGNETLWARLASPYASDGSGICFYPEQDDEVALGFVGGDPVILGSVHNPKQKAPFEPDAENGTKAIVLRDRKQKQALTFDRDKHEMRWYIDDVGKEKLPAQGVVLDMHKGIATTSREGDVTVLVEEGQGRWEAKAGLHLGTSGTLEAIGSKGIQARSDEDVHLDAGMELIGTGKKKLGLSSEASRLELAPIGVALTGTEVKLEAETDVIIKADNKVDVHGVDAVSVMAETTKITGANQVSVKSSIETVVNGGWVKVSGDQVRVEAAEIELG